MTSRKKLTISLTVVALVVIAAVVAVVGVLAATQQTVNSTVNITFTAVDIDGKVSASYAVQKKTETDLTDGTDAGSVTFVAAGTQTGTIAIGSTESPVDIAGSDNALYIAYTFTRAEVDYNVSVAFDNATFMAEYLNGGSWTTLTNSSTQVLANVAEGTAGSTVLMRISVIDASKSVETPEAINISFALNVVTQSAD